MKISIITATYNSATHIAGCLASVNNQTYKNIEHIIIDGASTDNTLEIIKSTLPKGLTNRVTRFVSEPRGNYFFREKTSPGCFRKIRSVLNLKENGIEKNNCSKSTRRFKQF